MNFSRAALIIVTMFLAWGASAAEVEGLAGVAVTSFDEELSDYNSFGASARVRYNWQGEDSGLFAMAFFNGENILFGDLMLGYRWITGSEVKLEAGLFGAYSLIHGPGLGGLVGPRWELGKEIYLSLPVVFRSSAYLGVSPMIGYRF